MRVFRLATVYPLALSHGVRALKSQVLSHRGVRLSTIETELDMLVQAMYCFNCTRVCVVLEPRVRKEGIMSPSCTWIVNQDLGWSLGQALFGGTGQRCDHPPPFIFAF
ncbi:hypothetical protein FOMG_14783 [Fusarium oxysporum f. sp. melonis 26406]|uniref:Uncharacterized protein n=1 Tax=Fusarium oxysporum f. sp. melonis 26406 TaxID=1089452 RepID=W9ZAU2_FUSOX|nr:hypothetical protein FOMG_14783 [Fusarium oxysporum f. sp. melonis 26406]EXK28909.1 hypothetical protein FOMG_14783 [Fusarium oxysporum f. sp. melonis 26406]EXK28910.1 hypothetical protein FOMG_14783 [Fusarium oxysporum f. sp. melonis 26406]EXK28911.1 hypothetical protein FOMG_14783 [Fusarium oxysporum f. sp. melonis 26406]